MGTADGRRLGSRSLLEDWQWAEAEADYRGGSSLRALAERYGVKLGTVQRHMTRRGIVPERLRNYSRGTKRGRSGKEGRGSAGV